MITFNKRIKQAISVTALSSMALMTGCFHKDDNKSSEQQAPENTILYHNAVIGTMNSQSSDNSNAMMVAGSDILAIGSLEELQKRYKNIDALNKIDLDSRYVMPGIIDTHTHPGIISVFGSPPSDDDEEGFFLRNDTKENLFADLQTLAQLTADEPFIFTSSWDVNLFLPAGPQKEDLDAIFGPKPVILQDNTGHSYWLNSAALAYFGIDKDTPAMSPNFSYFEKDDQGELTGWAKEFALIPYLIPIILSQQPDIENNVTALLDFMVKNGVTTLWDAGNFTAEDKIYEILKKLDDQDKLPVRYYASHHIFNPTQMEGAIDKLKSLREKYQGNMLKFDTIKIHYDGSHELGTAYVKKPYQHINGPVPNVGGVLFTAEQLKDFILELNKEDIDVHLHTVGDGATSEALQAIKLAKAATELSIEITLAHLEFTDPDEISDFSTLGVHANFTPSWSSSADPATIKTVGEEFTHEHYMRINSYFEQGANVTFSSDETEPYGAYERGYPFFGIQMGMTRREPGDTNSANTAQPENEVVSLQRMLQGYTINGAKQLGIEDLVGSLEAGKKADFIVLNENPATIDQNQIYKIKPDSVVIDGKLVSGEF